MKRIWKYGLLMAGVLAAAIAAGQLVRETSHGILYRVSGGKNELYLLGSIHVGSREMYPMGSAIQEALRQADVLIFECDTTSAEAAAETAQMMRTEVPLNELVSEECYAKVEQTAQAAGYEMASLDALKPWAVTSTFTVAAAAKGMEAGSTRQASALGVEDMVRRQSKGKEIAWLETATEQLGRLEAFSPELQEYLLDSACQALLDPGHVSGTDEDLPLWPGWWREGNARAFADSYQRSMEKETSPELAQEYHQSLVTERNLAMAHKLMEWLENDEPHTILATVGLMHLVLPGDSIIAHLQNAGYTVEQLFSK